MCRSARRNGRSRSRTSLPGGHTIELTASQDIEKGASDTFSKLLGRNIRGDETLQIVQQLQNLDRLNQATKFGQQDTVKGADFMQSMATAQERQAESNTAADQSLALHQQAANASAGSGSGPNTIIPGADTSGMSIGGHQNPTAERGDDSPREPAGVRGVGYQDATAERVFGCADG